MSLLKRHSQPTLISSFVSRSTQPPNQANQVLSFLDKLSSKTLTMNSMQPPTQTSSLSTSRFESTTTVGSGSGGYEHERTRTQAGERSTSRGAIALFSPLETNLKTAGSTTGASSTSTQNNNSYSSVIASQRVKSDRITSIFDTAISQNGQMMMANTQNTVSSSPHNNYFSEDVRKHSQGSLLDSILPKERRSFQTSLHEPSSQLQSRTERLSTVSSIGNPITSSIDKLWQSTSDEESGRASVVLAQHRRNNSDCRFNTFADTLSSRYTLTGDDDWRSSLKTVSSAVMDWKGIGERVQSRGSQMNKMHAEVISKKVEGIKQKTEMIRRANAVVTESNTIKREIVVAPKQQQQQSQPMPLDLWNHRSSLHARYESSSGLTPVSAVNPKNSRQLFSGDSCVSSVSNLNDEGMKQSQGLREVKKQLEFQTFDRLAAVKRDTGNGVAVVAPSISQTFATIETRQTTNGAIEFESSSPKDLAEFTEPSSFEQESNQGEEQQHKDDTKQPQQQQQKQEEDCERDFARVRLHDELSIKQVKVLTGLFQICDSSNLDERYVQEIEGLRNVIDEIINKNKRKIR